MATTTFSDAVSKSSLLSSGQQESAREDVRPGEDIAGAAIHADRDDDRAVLREMSPVAEHDVAHAARGYAIDEDTAVRDGSAPRRTPSSSISRYWPTSKVRIWSRG